MSFMRSSLVKSMMDDCVYMIRQIQPDGEGGFTTVYAEGTGFKAVISFDMSNEAQIAQVEGVTGLYTISTEQNINLQYRDVIKRLSDGKYFRITTDGDDYKTPKFSTLNMRIVRAEEFDIGNE